MKTEWRCEVFANGLRVIYVRRGDIQTQFMVPSDLHRFHLLGVIVHLGIEIDLMERTEHAFTYGCDKWGRL